MAVAEGETVLAAESAKGRGGVTATAGEAEGAAKDATAEGDAGAAAGRLAKSARSCGSGRSKFHLTVFLSASWTSPTAEIQRLSFFALAGVHGTAHRTNK